MRTLIIERTLAQAYTPYEKKIEPSKFKELIALDPTYVDDEKLGKYSDWIARLYLAKNLKEEDFYKVTAYLKNFIKFQSKLEDKDINHYKTLPDLAEVLVPFEGEETKSELHSSIKSVAKTYKFDDWTLVVLEETDDPEKMEAEYKASCLYGKGTKWCTAADDSDYQFKYHIQKGNLWIFINGNDKYQFHFETAQFMDKLDREINDIYELIEDFPIAMKNFLFEWWDKLEYHTILQNESIDNLYNEFRHYWQNDDDDAEREYWAGEGKALDYMELSDTAYTDFKTEYLKLTNAMDIAELLSFLYSRDDNFAKYEFLDDMKDICTEPVFKSLMGFEEYVELKQSEGKKVGLYYVDHWIEDDVSKLTDYDIKKLVGTDEVLSDYDISEFYNPDDNNFTLRAYNSMDEMDDLFKNTNTKEGKEMKIATVRIIQKEDGAPAAAPMGGGVSTASIMTQTGAPVTQMPIMPQKFKKPKKRVKKNKKKAEGLKNNAWDDWMSQMKGIKVNKGSEQVFASMFENLEICLAMDMYAEAEALLNMMEKLICESKQ